MNNKHNKKRYTQPEIKFSFFVEEISIHYKHKIPPSQRLTVKDSKQAYQIFNDSWNKQTIDLFEEFKMILLNRASRVIGMVSISAGGLTGTIADPRLIFSVALKTLASSIVISHNHPSGALKPSIEDEHLTKRLVEGGKLLDITVIDHLIITSEGFFSFADEGLIW